MLFSLRSDAGKASEDGGNDERAGHLGATHGRDKSGPYHGRRKRGPYSLIILGRVTLTFAFCIAHTRNS